MSLETGVTGLKYTATGLTKGSTYQFKIKGRSSSGTSSFSNTVSILAAGKPATPVAPSTEWQPDNVIIKWTAQDDGGSPITGYIVPIKQRDS